MNTACAPVAAAGSTTPVATEALPRVLGIASTRIVPPLLGLDASFDARLDWVVGETARQLADALAEGGAGEPLALVCSTTLSKMVSGWPEHTEAFFDRIEARAGLRPSGLLEAYQCTGWGYAVRFAATHTDSRWLILSIVDVDLHEAMAQGYMDVIGGIGFGITTVALDLTGVRQLPTCAGPFANHGFTDLLHGVRKHLRQTGPIPNFLPFLPAGLAGIAERTVGSVLGANRYAHYGHSFGSDPWIGLAEWLRAQPPEAPRAVTLGAFAYDGYFTLGSVSVDATTRVALRDGPLPACHVGERA